MNQPQFSDLVTMLQQTLARHGGRPAFGTKREGQWQWVTYAEFGRRVDAFRSGLAALGVGKGDRVAVISNNRLEWLVGCHATYGLGAAYVPMYEAQLDEEWKYILRDCAAKACLVSRVDIQQRVAAFRAEVEALEHVICFDAPEGDAASYRAVLALGEAKPLPPVIPAPEDIATFIYTSGTTGAPKGVKLTHAGLAHNVRTTLASFELGPEDRTVAFLPWAHVAGGSSEIHGVVSHGASSALCEHSDQLLQTLLEVRPSFLVAVPRVWNKVYDGVQRSFAEKPKPIRALFSAGLSAASKKQRGQALSPWEQLVLALADRMLFSKVRARFGGRLRAAISGAAALSADVAEFIASLGIPVYEAYGMTEVSSVACMTRPGITRLGSVGKPIAGVRITLDRQAPGADGEAGEIIIHSPGRMVGYHNLPELSAEVLTPDGGMRTGDLGYFDADGYLFVTGRVKEIYKLENGKYVSPVVVEEKLTLSPYIAQAMVYGANRPYNVALLVPNLVALKEWAGARGLSASPQELLALPQVRELIRAEVERGGESLRGFDRVKDFVLTADEFSVQNDMLTPTLKLKRRNVLKRYQAQLDGCYAGAGTTRAAG